MRDTKFFRVMRGFFLTTLALIFIEKANAASFGSGSSFDTPSTQAMNRGNVGAAYSGTAANPYPNQYNSGNSGTVMPGYNENYYRDDGDNDFLNNSRGNLSGVQSNGRDQMARPYAAAQYGTQPSGVVQYGAQPNGGVQAYGAAQGVSATPSEPQFIGGLTLEERSIYFGLNAEGKALALQLATQGGYQNRGIAVKEAQRRMNERSNGATYSR